MGKKKTWPKDWEEQRKWQNLKTKSGQNQEKEEKTQKEREKWEERVNSTRDLHLAPVPVQAKHQIWVSTRSGSFVPDLVIILEFFSLDDKFRSG